MQCVAGVYMTTVQLFYILWIIQGYRLLAQVEVKAIKMLDSCFTASCRIAEYNFAESHVVSIICYLHQIDLMEISKSFAYVENYGLMNVL